MNKSGLTLVELLAVIIIIAVLSVMIIPGIFAIRTSVLESTYENKVSQIISAAKDYGTENITELKSPVSRIISSTDELHERSEDCIYRTVGFLMSNGYLKTSNSYVVNKETSDFIDPRTNKPMNNMSVCIRFDNNNVMTRMVIAYIVEE